MRLMHRQLLAASLAGLAVARPTIPGLADELPVRLIQGADPSLNDLERVEAEAVISFYQTKLGPDATPGLVSEQVAAADAFWRAVVANSTGGWKAGIARIQGYAPTAVFNATSVGTWFDASGTGWPNGFLGTSPTHYASYAAGGVADAADVIETVEGWGTAGPITSFRGRAEAKPAFEPPLPEFPAAGQSPLAMSLQDGTVFAHSLTAARDLPGGGGVEIFEGIWVPDSTPAYVVDGLTEHLTVEFTNWLRFAYKLAVSS
ncbi:hypothetical protein GGR56DRAFT_687958 [Xylariaceae sp. FL0804]|nr:hypothetical protein GGR56DRAFT_687958 [Xylariaceae sp. FL0804]